jgi:hypothetical protein
VEDWPEDIIPPRQRCLHHACATGKPTPKGTYSTPPGRKAALPSTSEVYRPPDAKGAEALAGGSAEPGTTSLFTSLDCSRTGGFGSPRC